MTAPYCTDDAVEVWHGDCLDVLRQMPDNSVDAVVTDPPYSLFFMGRAWDSHESPFGFQQWCEQWAAECLRVLKPGGHMLAFGGTRTWHRLACAVEDAGFEVRDSIAWLYGSGFPKSLDVSKAIDKESARSAAQPSPDVAAAGIVAAWLRTQCSERGVTSRHVNEHFGAANIAMRWLMAEPTATKRPQVPTWEQWAELRRWLRLPDTMDAEVWRLNGNKGRPSPLAFARASKVYADSHGFARVGLAHGAQKSHTATTQVEEQGFATGPGDEPVTPAAQQWQGWGTALKPAFEPIVVARKPLSGTVAANVQQWGTGALNIDGCRVGGKPRTTHARGNVTGVQRGATSLRLGVGDGFESEPPAGRWPTNVVLDGDQADALDEQSGTLTSGLYKPEHADNGKAAGTLGAMTGRERATATYGDSGGASRFFPVFRYQAKAPTRERVKVGGVAHPTVKPVALTRWLVRLVTPPGGTVLDPFAGSGTTIEAAMLEGFRCVGIEREADYLPLIQARIARARAAEPPPGDVPLFEEPAKPGRWPTNVVMDRGQAAELDDQSGTLTSGAKPSGGQQRDNRREWRFPGGTGYGDSGGASRFFPVFDHDPLTLWGDDEDGAA